MKLPWHKKRPQSEEMKQMESRLQQTQGTVAELEERVALLQATARLIRGPKKNIEHHHGA